MSKRLTAEQVLQDLRDCRDSFQQAGCDRLAKCYEYAASHVERNLIETDEQRRERFEQWWIEDCRRRKSSARTERSAGGSGYVFADTDLAWHAFQAALTWHGETEGGGE